MFAKQMYTGTKIDWHVTSEKALPQTLRKEGKTAPVPYFKCFHIQ